MRPSPDSLEVQRMSNPFQSFWMGGYEGADHINSSGLPLDMGQVTGHVDWVEQDHQRAADVGIRVVRESIEWRLS